MHTVISVKLNHDIRKLTFVPIINLWLFIPTYTFKSKEIHNQPAVEALKNINLQNKILYV